MGSWKKIILENFWDILGVHEQYYNLQLIMDTLYLYIGLKSSKWCNKFNKIWQIWHNGDNFLDFKEEFMINFIITLSNSRQHSFHIQKIYSWQMLQIKNTSIYEA